jgi:hypothetical protein
LRRIELIGDLQHALEANDLGNVSIHDPDHIDRAANTNNGGGCFDLKCPLLKFHQVFGKHLQFSRHHLEFSVSFFFDGIEFKLVQMKIRLFAHGHVAAVFESQPHP